MAHLPNDSVRIHLSFWITLILLGISILGVMQTGGDVFWRILYICVSVLIVSAINGILSVRGFVVKRSAREARKEFGQVFEERFEVINRFPFRRTWLEIDDGSKLPGIGGGRVLTRIGKNELRNYSAYTLLIKRGEYRLGPTRIRSGDFFGFFTFTRTLPHYRNLIVLPLMVDVQFFPYPPGLMPGGKARRFRSFEVTPHAAGVREYVWGDELKRIHWPTTARRGELIVKEFEKNPRAPVWIFLDAQRGVHVRQPEPPVDPNVDQFWLWQKKEPLALLPDTMEYAVSLSASIARYFIHNGQDVGLAAAGQRLLILPAESGERQLGKLLEILALLEDCGSLPLRALVENQVPLLPRGSVVVLVTTTTRSDILLSVDVVLKRDMRPVVVLVRAGSFGGEDMEGNLYAALQRRNIPVTLAENGDDLRQVLEAGFASALPDIGGRPLPFWKS